MTEPRMEVRPGHGCVCTRCNYAFEARRDGEDVVVRHTAAWDRPDFPEYMVRMLMACPLQGRKFRYPAMRPVVMEEVW